MTVSFQNGSYFNGSASASTGTKSGGITASSLYNTDYLDRKYDYTDSKESYEIAYSGRDAAIESEISNILSYISAGKEDKALESYEALLNEMSSQTRYEQLLGENGDDTQLRAVAKDLIEQELGQDESGNGITLEEFISENTKTNKQVEAQQIYRGKSRCDSTSQEDLLNEMCNMDMDETHLTGFGKFFRGIASIVTRPWTALTNDGTKY